MTFWVALEPGARVSIAGRSPATKPKLPNWSGARYPVIPPNASIPFRPLAWAASPGFSPGMPMALALTLERL
jgi:hypothetical protein